MNQCPLRFVQVQLPFHDYMHIVPNVLYKIDFYIFYLGRFLFSVFPLQLFFAVQT